MKVLRRLALAWLLTATLTALAADIIAPHDYAAQFRDRAGEGPSLTFPLGTDELGRDRFSRLLGGARISLFCAPIAALVSTALAAMIGLAGGYSGGLLDELTTACSDLFLSIPWLFALLTLRAFLPLNVSPWVSIATTYLFLAAVGWASGARVIRGSVSALRVAGFVQHAIASGCPRYRVLRLHILPNLKPVLVAQFWVLVPIFLLTEANLGALGLGVAEPVPSLGNMLAELQNYERIREAPWILAPAVFLVAVVASLHAAFSGDDR